MAEHEEKDTQVLVPDWLEQFLNVAERVVERIAGKQTFFWGAMVGGSTGFAAGIVAGIMIGIALALYAVRSAH
ncbi:MAG: hypothetical protein A3C84_02165 [Candidatus Ryanbacteria bacterium RIFCSPHIGHO2_02_FULL_48_12]|uniref:Uncharacterized protein n=1 Tax=Candidatus Ryanbacteria bacterium RIFCSPHIGHO2_01_FULL_48_27 TaxID=1802115 RepID=A0A1G2G349_9BACT|nr:MAG: hypothetical protein A2756_04595 [Candidatus Ryanbacteria bacterium RIFCSPHIGHO2_01_FULL_48_27]OGZ49258.1 MAG: hypothetical protein A3C84_02165 [Candidatus Ryanbacteria bacterium RIFCSPHIGHO2_02_FULL_48_12]